MHFLIINLCGLRKTLLSGLRRGTIMANSYWQYIQIARNFPQKSGYTCF